MRAHLRVQCRKEWLHWNEYYPSPYSLQVTGCVCGDTKNFSFLGRIVSSFISSVLTLVPEVKIILCHLFSSQTWSISPRTVLCSTLTWNYVWTDKPSLWLQTQWPSCCLKSCQSTTLCCGHCCTNWASKTSGCVHGRSSEVSVAGLWPPLRELFGVWIS